MVKSTKKSTVNHGKPITEFFKRAPKTPTSTPPSASQTSQAGPSTAVKGPTTKAPVQQKSKPATAKQPSASQDKFASPANSSQPAMADTSQQEISDLDEFLKAPSSSPGSRKRTRSPSPEPSPKASSSRAGPSRKKSASPTKPNGLPFKKKTRLTSPGVEVEQVIVPSSQSDEEDLSMESIPRPITNNTVSINHILSMDVDKDESKSTTSASSPPSPMLSEGQSSPEPNRPSSMPPTPVALTQAAKAAKMIEEIRKKAYARVSSSPEPKPISFDVDMSSSDDDDDLLMPLKIMPPKPTKPAEPAKPTTRQSARLKGRSASPSPQKRSTRASSSRLTPPVVVAPKKPPPKASKHVPFEALLKEQRQAVKKGVDEAALRMAEETAERIANGIADGMESEEEDDDDWDVKGVVQDPKSFIEKLGMVRDAKAGGKSAMDEETRKMLFGAPKEKGALEILNDDLKVRGHDESVVKVAGIAFWEPCRKDEDAMCTDEVLPEEPTGASPAVNLLKMCLRRKDVSRITKVLYSNFMQSVSPAERDSMASYLYDIVFSPRQYPEALRTAAFHALHQFWTTSVTHSLTFTRILETVCSLGASSQALSSSGWDLQDVAPMNVDEKKRQSYLQRLLALLNHPSNVQPESIVDVIVLLLFIGMDTKATPEFLLDIARVTDGLGQSLSSNPASQIALCSKVVKAGGGYQAVNKDRLVSLLSSGSGPIRQVASFVGYAFVTDKDILQPEIYLDAPPLTDILTQLTERSKFAVDRDTDYVDLGFFVNMLAAAVYDLRSYACLERESANKQGEKTPKTDLQRLHKALETMHNDIADTRATHLERSRTKGVIKGLAMTIHYQREFWIKHGAPERPKTLAQYFTKK